MTSKGADNRQPASGAEGLRVGVIGAGIAGCGAAWALHRGGAEVTLLEASERIGGNAKTWTWHIGDREIVSGLSVLAWPDAYFRNYGRLVEALGVASERVRLRFFVRHGDDVYAHGRDTPMSRRFAGDLARWERLVGFVRRVNRTFAASPDVSLYHASALNPMNVVRARWLARLFGVSDAFWDDVLVALYSSSFLTVRLDGLPAVILPALDDMISAADGGVMRTWSGSSAEVFERLVAGFEDRVLLRHRVTRIAPDDAGVEVEDASGQVHRFDKVIYAGNATWLARCLESPTPLQRRLFERVHYGDDTDPSFLVGQVHGNADVLPEAHRRAVLDEYCTFIDVVEAADGSRRYENHFVVSSWLPAARGTDAVMIVSYNRPDDRPIEGIETRISNRGAHPTFSLGNLAVASLLRFVQGKDHLYYCGCWTTPGNGHDLSLLSGLVVAHELGAPYPFDDDSEARADFDRLRRLMLGRRRGRS